MTYAESISEHPPAGAGDIVEFPATLPVLIERASRTLMEARSSAEVLEARDMARVAYDAAKSAGRIAKAKRAHDEVLAAVHRAQADALLVEARAKMRLADEYDAAQDRGEVAKIGDNLPSVGDPYARPATAADIGLRRDEIQEARQLRDAEKASPGKAERVLKQITDRGEEPTKAKLKRELIEESAPTEAKSVGPADAERRKIAKLPPDAMVDEIVGLRADLADEKTKSAKLKRERDELAERLAEALADDQGKTIGNLQKQLRAAKYARDEALTAAKRMEYRLKQAEKRVAELEALGIAV